MAALGCRSAVPCGALERWGLLQDVAESGGVFDSARTLPEWVRCLHCGNAIWRREGDHVVMALHARGGQKRRIRVPLGTVAGLQVECEKCGSVLLASPDGTWSTLP